MVRNETVQISRNLDMEDLTDRVEKPLTRLA